MKRRKRVYAYITNGDRLLVFKQPAFPEAGIQVPAGTVKDGEDLPSAVLREAKEETGLAELELIDYLGTIEREMISFGIEEIQEASFFHLLCPGNRQDRWSHEETSGGERAPILFDFFWVSFTNGIPELIALSGAFLGELRSRLR